MSKKIVFELSHESIERAKHELLQYQNDINRKVEKFVSRLADVGIRVGEANVGKYGEYLTFSKDLILSNKGEVQEIIAMKSKGLITVEWNVKDGTHSAEINPLLMAEFGSGFIADEERGQKFGAGQGTLNTYGHAFDSDGWFWVDSEGKHRSWGEAPLEPMFKASQEMILSIRAIAKEVFGND